MKAKAKRRGTAFERGVTLIETMFASAILLVGVGGVMSLLTLAVTQSEGQGEVATRTTQYSQDKMDQLMALQFTDSSTDTTEGTGNAVGLTVGGSTTTAQSGYVDYLDVNGDQLTSSAKSYYTRMWSISTNAGGNLMTITVVTTGQNTGGRGAKPSSTLVCLKSQ